MRPIKDIFNTLDIPDLLVGLDEPDDAAVWRLDEDRALVVTTDFFTPVVDDAFDYGAIAAANSISDLYAMGATPFLGLNILGLPPQLPKEIGTEILRGGALKAREAGLVIAGGHTVQDEEPKYGLIALGFAVPDQIMTKRGAQVGDHLILSKPLGFGVSTTALKQEKANAKEIEEVISWMKTLNSVPAKLAREYGLKAATDITGFGLLGHAWEIADASKLGLIIEYDRLPFVSCAKKFAAEWTFPGGAHDNKHFFGSHVTFSKPLPDEEKMLLFDPQTSGGLLLCVPEEHVNDLMATAKELGNPVWDIGQVCEGNSIEIV